MITKRCTNVINLFKKRKGDKMKKLITIAAVLMMFCAGNVFAVEPRAIILDENQNTAYVYNSDTGLKIASYVHYSNYGVPTGGSGYQVITNSATGGRIINGDGSLVLSTTTENNKQTAVSIGTLRGFVSRDYHRY